MQISDIPKQYTVKRAIERLVNRFKNERVFVKAEDLTALKEVANALNFLFAQNKRNDNAFFKLGCVLLLNYIRHYKSWKIAVKQLKNDLDMPIEFYEKMITSETNSVILSNTCETLNVEHFYNEDEQILNGEKTSVEIESLSDEDLEKLKKGVFGYSESQIKEIIYDVLNDLFIRHGTNNRPWRN